jgi:Domain of unknown function (DUF4783)
MKRFLFTLILVLSIFGSSFAQSEFLDDVSSAFKNADQRLLSKYFGNKIEITLLDQSNVYSKSQAEMVMKDFFSKYDPIEFQLLYKNNPSNDAARFAIGQLDTRAGKFRIYFILKTSESGLYLQEMRFEQERTR